MYRTSTTDQPILNIRGIERVRHYDSLFQYVLIYFERPGRNEGLKTKLAKKEMSRPLNPSICKLGSSKQDRVLVTRDLLIEPRDHHGSASWGGKIRDEKSMISTSGDPQESAGGIAAEAVGDKPFSR
jgi:hypothetical protein